MSLPIVFDLPFVLVQKESFASRWGVIHSIINIALVYVILLIGGPNIATVIAIFILNLVCGSSYFMGAVLVGPLLIDAQKDSKFGPIK
ncbi:hypothetical protein AC249_AIPGENE18778 [Exaiptasia diaphana]|nr:hypothetical protein AC249_AIPGENE18778 [Exaiptasia diaphana]